MLIHGKRGAGVEGRGRRSILEGYARFSSGEINTSKTTRPLCLSSCLVIPGGYRTNGLFQVISRARVVVPSTRRALSPRTISSRLSRTHARLIAIFLPRRMLGGHFL